MKTIRNVSYCLKVRVLTDIQTKFFRLLSCNMEVLKSTFLLIKYSVPTYI